MSNKNISPNPGTSNQIILLFGEVIRKEGIGAEQEQVVKTQSQWKNINFSLLHSF